MFLPRSPYERTVVGGGVSYGTRACKPYRSSLLIVLVEESDLIDCLDRIIITIITDEPGIRWPSVMAVPVINPRRGLPTFLPQPLRIRESHSLTVWGN